MTSGGMAERLNAAVLKTAVRLAYRGFEPLSLRPIFSQADDHLWKARLPAFSLPLRVMLRIGGSGGAQVRHPASSCQLGGSASNTLT